MKVTTVSPSERLAPFVRTFTVVETDGEAATRVLMPDTGLIVGLRFGGTATELNGNGPTRMAAAAIVGLRNTARRMWTSPGGGMVLAAFHAEGAAQFLSEPLHELFGHTFALDDLIPRSEVEEARSRIAEAADHAQRVAIFEGFLLGRQLSRAPDPIIIAAVRAIRATHGSLRIAALARRLGITQDALEKRFRHAVGATPKQFASILRLRHAVNAHRSGASLTRASIDAGYFDQSHFNREFRMVMGEAPGQFFGNGDYC